MSPNFLASSSNTLMNSSPIIFLLVSGSETPFNLPKNLSWALTLIRFISKPSLKIFSTWSPSSFLNRPWSTKIQVNCLPTALWTITAATDESTPPDNAHINFLSPTIFLISAIFSSAKEAIDQEFSNPHIL